MKKLAVIMSIYKNDRLIFVKQAIESILAQTYDEFDFYIQYDGPVADDVRGYIASLADERIEVQERKENKGLAQSLNDLLAIVMPQGYEYIARMDADDISMPDRFEKQVFAMEQDKTVECLGTWAIEIKGDNSEYFQKQMPVTHGECRELFKKRDCMIHPTVMFRRSYIEKAGLYSLDTYFGEDTMMWARGFASGCKFGNIPEYLFCFRLDDNFFDRRHGWKHAINIFKLRKRVNKMLGFGLSANISAFMYAVAKMMPSPILNIIYKIAR